MSPLFSLAFRNVARNRRRSAVTLAAIALGLAAALVLRGFSEGFLALVVDDVVKGRTGALQVHRAGYVDSVEGAPLELDLPQTPGFVAKLRGVDGVTAVTPRIQFTGLVSNGFSQTNFIGRGLDLATESEVCPRFGYDVAPGGTKLTTGDRNQALLGYELASSFGAVPPAEKAKAAQEGRPDAQRWVDLVTLASSSPKGRANSLDVTVKGLTQSGSPFENKRVVTVPLTVAQDLLGMQGRVTEYAIAVRDLRELDAVAARLREALGPEYEVHTWSELQPFFRDVIVRQRFVFALISMILFVIILTGIINTMLMSVFERVREIGTMMAVGVRRRQVLAMFLIEAATLGAIGGVLGALLGRAMVGLLAQRGIPMKVIGAASASLLRPTIGVSYVVMAVVVAALGAVVAALYPAWKASRLLPVEALRSI